MTPSHVTIKRFCSISPSTFITLLLSTFGLIPLVPNSTLKLAYFNHFRILKLLLTLRNYGNIVIIIRVWAYTALIIKFSTVHFGVFLLHYLRIYFIRILKSNKVRLSSYFIIIWNSTDFSLPKRSTPFNVLSHTSLSLTRFVMFLSFGVRPVSYTHLCNRIFKTSKM